MILKLRGQSYPIQVGAGISNKLVPYLKKNKVHRVLLIADERLSSARQSIRDQFSKGPIEFNEIALPAGEGLKDFKTIYPIYGELLKLKLDRDSVIIALGGGSIGDAVGFIASTYLRGIRWIGLPTTLLAQVDSSVGGKTGVNHEAGKNLIGTFHQPVLVLCDTEFLKTLSPREIASGLGEIVKYGITFDPKFFKQIENNLEALLKLDAKRLKMAIETSLNFKVKAVTKDEFDQKGVREVLNFGHTFGHALESMTRYEVYQHGEAVIWGMRFALALSVERKHLKTKDAADISALLKKIPVPPLPADLDFNQILTNMKKDKKSSRNAVRFVLLKRLGRTISDRKVTEDDLKKAFARMST